MSYNLYTFTGYSIRATDGEIGRISTFFFDDATWLVRYIVIDTGEWLQDRRVLLKPFELRDVDENRRQISVELTQEQIRQAPNIDTAKPISRQHQLELHRYYDWPQYWTMSKDQNISGLLSSVPELDEEQSPEPLSKSSQLHGIYDDPHLREDMRVVLGYQIHALDGLAGTLENVVIDESTWRIQFLVVDGKQTVVNKTVLIPPDWVIQIEWAEAGIYADLFLDSLQTSPDFDLSSPVDRKYERLLYEHYAQKTAGSRKLVS